MSEPTDVDTGAQSQIDERSRAVRRLMTSVGNPALERLAQLASRLLAAPASQVSLLGEDFQTVGAAGGIITGATGQRTQIADSVCRITAGLGTPLVVPDATVDQRLREITAVNDGLVRAYLGVPLVGKDGRVVGAMCVYDAQVRAWSRDDVLLLSDLAAAAVSELELSALAVDYETDRMRWRMAVTAAGVGSFDWDLSSGRLNWDEQLLELFGVGSQDFGGTIDAFNSLLHPDDVERVGEALAEAIATCSSFAVEYRVQRPDGALRWVSGRGTALIGPHGEAVRVLGVAYDTTAERLIDTRISRVLETMTNAFYLIDHDWRFAYVNAEAERLLGRHRSELLGGVIWDLFPAANDSVFEENYREAVRSGVPRSFEAYYPPPLDGWYELRAWPGPDGLSVYFHDITARRRAEQQARATSRRLAVLAEVSDDLATLVTDDAIRRLTTHLVPAFGTWCLLTLWTEQRQLRDIASTHAEASFEALVARYADLRLEALEPTSYLHEALNTGRLVTARDATNAISGVLSGEARSVLRSLAPETAYAIPMRARGKTIGAITLFLDKGRPELDDEDLTLLTQIADRAGVALENARLYEGQRGMAASLQHALLTQPVEPDDLDVVVRYVPAAAAAEVGGDWYDAFMQRDGSTNLVIGDVIGHDTRAAAAMSQFRTLLRGIAYTTGASPAKVLEDLDEAVNALDVGSMATAVVLRLEQSPEERRRGVTRLRWSNAGHPPPVLIYPNGTVHELAAGNPDLLLGLRAQSHRSDTVRTVARGATVLLFTDGLVERRGEHLRLGYARLYQHVERLVPAAQARAAVHGRFDTAFLVDELLTAMTEERAPEDDVAMLAVHLSPQD
ncbi:SpoIIE family protein phosphatase [Cellulomonas endometrii]|uniref:SpoIIE family protein phosphatase n=1 Tax=Cellulomonas endometrii TaxID=3036301 RepID=UPI0024AE41AC|nr:SpoIIE family protein phosphatase [Cellulomonas endometrii]